MNHVAPQGITRAAFANALKNALAKRGMVAPAAVDMASVAPSAAEYDINQLLQGILSSANATAAAKLQAEEAPEPTKPAVAAEVFEFVPVKNKEGRYRLISPALREFIYHSMDFGHVSHGMLEQPSDSQADKEARTRHAVIALETFYAYFRHFKEITRDDIEDAHCGLTFDQYSLFIADLEQRYTTHKERREAEEKALYEEQIAAFNSGTVTFDQLQTGLTAEVKKGSVFVFKAWNQDQAGKLTYVIRQKSMMGPYLQIGMEVYSVNEVGLTKTTHVHTIFNFGGEDRTATLADLGIVRLEAGSAHEKTLIERGAKYIGLTTKKSFVRSTGMMTRKRGRDIEMINAIGRVMIDLEGMTNMDPNYYDYFCKADEDEETIQFKEISELSDAIKLACVPVVYGFSFKAKRWGQLNVNDIEKIEFREDAYEKLVLDQDTKNLIFASVTDEAGDNDIIAGKGGGSINLLEGPPGVGKTLTAEAVAEMLKRPLYMVSVGELGTTVDELEANLKDILEIAAAWNAVLLIDEADIFLETRDKKDVIRNAMVAVFLRLLEYYQGVLFLTTNRADNLDPAFESRITLCIHYSNLAVPARKQVWANLMKAAKLETSLFDLDQLANHVLNGRQIKGIIKSARALAKFEGHPLSINDFERVIKQKADFKAAAVYKMGAGLDDHKNTIDVEVKEVKKGFFGRVWDAIVGK